MQDFTVWSEQIFDQDKTQNKTGFGRVATFLRLSFS